MVRLGVFCITFGSLLVASTGFSKRLEPFETHFGVTSDFRLDTSPLMGDGSFRLEDLKADHGQWQSYQEFLEYLKRRAPDFFENYVLVHTSGSLQKASLQSPRVLARSYGMILTFAEPSSSVSRTVEIMAFDDQTRSLELHEIVFPENGVASFRENPEECQACHGKPAKPLWNPYDFWPKIYGSRIGVIALTKEYQAHESFLEGADSGVYPYLTPYRKRVKDIEGFTDYVSNLNYIRIAKELKGAANLIDGFEPAILGVLNQCSTYYGVDFEEFFPRDIYRRFPQSLDRVYRDTKKKRDAFKAFLQEMYQTRFGERSIIDHARLESEVKVLAEFRFILEGIGIATDWMTMSNEMNDVLLSSPSNFSMDLAQAFVDVFADRVRDLNPKLMDNEYFYWIQHDCRELAAKSRERLSQIDRTRIGDSSTDGFAGVRETVIHRCSSCHVNPTQSDIPQIPFFDNQRLAEALVANNGYLAKAIQERIHAQDDSQMPPGEPLTPEEKNALELVLKRIAEH